MISEELISKYIGLINDVYPSYAKIIDKVDAILNCKDFQYFNSLCSQFRLRCKFCFDNVCFLRNYINNLPDKKECITNCINNIYKNMLETRSSFSVFYNDIYHIKTQIISCLEDLIKYKDDMNKVKAIIFTYMNLHDKCDFIKYTKYYILDVENYTKLIVIFKQINSCFEMMIVLMDRRDITENLFYNSITRRFTSITDY